MTTTQPNPDTLEALDTLRRLARERERGEQRLDALRAELALVHADRERMHRSLMTRTSEPPAASSRGGAAGWVAFGSAFALVAGLFAFIVTHPPPPVVVRPMVVAPATPPAMAPAPVTAAPIDPAPAAPTEPRVRTTPRATPSQGTNPRTDAPRTSDDPLRGLERCGNDPTCGAR